jgi:hypothetical protein
LDVYDVSGRHVVSLVGQHQTQGTHDVFWDATGQSSGLYFARLQAPDGVATASVVIVK